MMKTVLIVIGLIFLYLLIGYIFTAVLLSLGDDATEEYAPWLTTSDPEFSYGMDVQCGHL